jgi:hypothetical protein
MSRLEGMFPCLDPASDISMLIRTMTTMGVDRLVPLIFPSHLIQYDCILDLSTKESQIGRVTLIHQLGISL